MTRTKSGKPQPRSARNYTGRAEVFVSIYCDGEATHDKWRIATLSPEVRSEELIWHVNTAGYSEPGVDGVLPVARNSSQWLVEDKWINQDDHDPMIFYNKGFRVRWSFKCRTCGMERPVSRPDELYPALSALARLGIREVELSHLVHASPPS